MAERDDLMDPWAEGPFKYFKSPDSSSSGDYEIEENIPQGVACATLASPAPLASALTIAKPIVPRECIFEARKTKPHVRNMNFLHNFDPEKSARERRKVNRKSYFNSRRSKAIYNEKGEIAVTGKDLCDCLDETCPGCHFPCPKCSSNKCALECRVNRKWMYDKIEIEGNDFVIKNDYKSK